MKRIYLLPVVCLLIGQFFLSSCTFNDTETADIPLQTSKHDITLRDFSNKIILLSFGYTHCPDICPATLMHVSEALDLLSDYERKRVQSIFVSLDPDRDTPVHLAEYVNFFHSELIGATANEENLQDFMKAFNIESFRLSDKENYEMSHTSYLFLIDENAQILDMMGHQTKPEDVVKSIREKLKRNG